MKRGPDTVRVPVEWALWGKHPGDRGHRIMECSRGQLSGNDFDEIMDRFSSGTPDELPEVTISWFGRGEQAHLGLAIQEWSDDHDKLGRDIAVTRYYCVPYLNLAKRPVSYETLFEAFQGRRLPVSGPLVEALPVLQPETVAGRVTEQAKCTAALLLTRKPVCIVQAESVLLPDRLRFLDTVASLLPYGMRSKFSASTWTSSTAEHRIRLSFTKYPRDDAHTVLWGEVPEIPAKADVARVYLDLMTRYARPEDLVARLAAATGQLQFREGDVLDVLDLLDASDRPPRFQSPWSPPPRLPAQQTTAEVITACAKALEIKRADIVAEHVTRLEYMATRGHTGQEQARYQEIYRDRQLLAEQPPIDDGLRHDLFKVLLRLAFGPHLDLGDVSRIETIAGTLHRPLLWAMHTMPAADPMVLLAIGSRLGPVELSEALGRITEEELVEMAARTPADARTVQVVCAELTGRGVGGENAALAPALHARGYLAPVLREVFPDGTEYQYDLLVELLTSAYGPTLGHEEFEEVVGGRTGPPTAALLGAALHLYGPGSRELLVDAVIAGWLGSAGFAPKTLRHLVGLLEPLPGVEPPPPSPLAAGKPGRRATGRWWPRLRKRAAHHTRTPSEPVIHKQASTEEPAQHLSHPLDAWVYLLLILLIPLAVVIVLVAETR